MIEVTWCYALVYIAEAFIGWLYLSEIFQPKVNKYVLWLLYGLGYGIAFVVFRDHLVWLNIFVFILLHIGLIRIGYISNWIGALFHSCLLTAFMFVAEIVTAFPLSMLFSSFKHYQTNSASLLLFTVISKILYFVLTKICLHVGREEDTKTVEGPIPLLLSSFSVASIVILVTFGYIGLTESYDKRISLLIMLVSIVLLFSDIFLYMVYQKYKRLAHENFILQLVQQRDIADKNYFTALEEHYDGQRILIHDIRKHLRTIREIAKDNEDAEVFDYVSDLEDTPELQHRIRYCDHSVLNVLLSHYAEICKKKNIQISVDVRVNTVDILCSSDITALFGNLWENAVTAAENAEDPYIELIIDVKGIKKLICVSLINTCSVEPQKDSKGNFVTQKSSNNFHGVGLKSVRKVIERHDGQMKQYFDSSTKTFHTVIVLPISKE